MPISAERPTLSTLRHLWTHRFHGGSLKAEAQRVLCIYPVPGFSHITAISSPPVFPGTAGPRITGISFNVISYNINQMALELNYCLCQLAYGNIGFLIGPFT